jgi:hypothetical protein
VDFKIFDPRDSGIQVDSAAGDTTTDTITITGNNPSTGSTGSVLSGNFDPTTGTGTQNALVCLKEDGLKMNGQIRLQGTVGGDVIFVALGENTGLNTLPGIGLFDFSVDNTNGINGFTAAAPNGHKLNFNNGVSGLNANTRSTFCVYPQNEGLCSLQNGTFKAVQGAATCPVFSSNAALTLNVACQP